MPLFSGAGVALVTLFDDAGTLDAPATADHAARLVDAGVACVLVAGTTGEAVALTTEERRVLVHAVRSALPPDVPVLAGVGAATGRQALALARDALQAGADALLALSPPRVPDPRPYYDALAAGLADRDGRPLLAYHYPDATPPGIPVELLGELPVDGIKDSSGDAGRLLLELDLVPDNLYTGSSALTLTAGVLGATGALLAAANIAPELCVRAWKGDASAQRELATAHHGSARDWPRGVKRLTAERWGTSTAVRVGG